MPADRPLSVKDLKPGIHYRYGTRRPNRPCPSNFREVFLRIGWNKEIFEIFNANTATIVRWIDECGGEDLRLARAATSGGRTFPQRRCCLPTYADAVAAILAD